MPFGQEPDLICKVYQVTTLVTVSSIHTGRAVDRVTLDIRVLHGDAVRQGGDQKIHRFRKAGTGASHRWRCMRQQQEAGPKDRQKHGIPAASMRSWVEVAVCHAQECGAVSRGKTPSMSR
jgi:hypothetical protein